MNVVTTIAVAVAAVLFGVVGLMAVALAGVAAPAASLGLDAASVPIAGLVPVLDAAGSLCPGVSAPLLAAQIEVESGWNPNAVSSAGAEGIAQFEPATFAAYAADDDPPAAVSPFDATDAVMAMGRYDCSLFADVSPLADAPGQPAESLMLAAYNAGVGAVLEYRGRVPYPETEAYVTKVESLVSTYAITLAAGPETAFGQAVVVATTGELGVPYSWGGGSPAGPTLGSGTGAATTGFDCSGLVLFAIAQASGGQILLPHSSEIQATLGTPVAPADIEPGDVIAFALGADTADFDHIGIYIGNDQMIDAPDTGSVVRVDTLGGSWLTVPSVIRSFG